MHDQEKTLDKIKKLLRLSKNQGASPAESSQALSKALQLAKEAGINIDQVDESEDNYESISHLDIKRPNFGLIEQLSCSIVEDFFHVKTIFMRKPQGNCVTFIGANTSCILASYAFDYISKSMQRAWKNADKRFNRTNYLRGFAEAILNQMPDAFYNPGLKPSYDSYIKDVIFGGRSFSMKSTTIGKGSKNALASNFAGYVAGKNAGIRNGLDGTKKLQ